MYSFSFLLSQFFQFRATSFQLLKSALIFLTLHLLFFFPAQHLEITQSQTVFILQFISLLTLFIQTAPSFRTDMDDGTLEKWLGNQGSVLSYLLANYMAVIGKIVCPIFLLLNVLLYSLDLEAWQFFSLGALFFINLMIAVFWCGNISLLLAKKQEGGAAIVGVMLVGIFLIPQLLVTQALMSEISNHSFLHIDLYGGLSLLNIALSLAFAPVIVKFSASD